VNPAAELVHQPPECRFIPLPQPPYELQFIQIVPIIDACKILILRSITKKGAIFR
jgi:hypothetical protein